MDWMNVLVPIVSLIAGWFLNEMSKKFQLGRERKALIGRALSNLLELHHQIRAVETSFQFLVSRFALPAEAKASVRQLLQQIIPQSDAYVTRYEEAVSQLSESDPITAFRLSTSAQIPRFLTLMQTMVSAEGTPDENALLAEKQMREIFVPLLELAIMELARLHGRSTYKQVKHRLATPTEFPEEFNQLSQIIQKAQQDALGNGGSKT
jgi:hypothetical protein